MSNEAIRLDPSSWPVVVVEPLRVPAPGEVARFVVALEALASERNAPFAVLLDNRRNVKLSRAQRREVAQGFKQGAILRHAKGEAVLLHSTVLAVLARVLLRVMRPKFPMGAFADYEAALSWAQEQARIGL